MNSLTMYMVLQFADLVITLIFLSLGVQEANAFVLLFIHRLGPIFGLFLVKLLGVGFGLVWWYRGRSMRPVNICYSILFAWNLTAVVLVLPFIH